MQERGVPGHEFHSNGTNGGLGKGWKNLDEGIDMKVVTMHHRHQSIRKLMREEYPNIIHQSDPWLVAKGVHRWEENGMEYKCYHKELTRDQQRMKKWLSMDSPVYKPLVEIVMDTCLLKDLEQMMLFKHTGMFMKKFDLQVV
ncbi:hypothetical protein QQF64_036283 [Cirrhinus molitorella]|uniref:Uncharacterized protein n=1 Tax=Cirrhinus molitorella TaxID=172907 RepID=A0ABR3NI39_9TELE